MTLRLSLNSKGQSKLFLCPNVQRQEPALRRPHGEKRLWPPHPRPNFNCCPAAAANDFRCSHQRVERWFWLCEWACVWRLGRVGPHSGAGGSAPEGTGALSGGRETVGRLLRAPRAAMRWDCLGV